MDAIKASTCAAPPLAFVQAQRAQMTDYARGRRESRRCFVAVIRKKEKLQGKEGEDPRLP